MMSNIKKSKSYLTKNTEPIIIITINIIKIKFSENLKLYQKISYILYYHVILHR